MGIDPVDKRLWADFLVIARPKVDWSLVGRVLCLDPGETTGWAIFNEGLLAECGQWDTGRDPASLSDAIHAVNAAHALSHLVYETYRIRGNKAQEHVGSEVVTIQHIGAIKVAASWLGIEPAGQSAGMAKGFATDTKLRRWGLYQSNLRHANDSIRHGCYWHLFVAGRQQP